MSQPQAYPLAWPEHRPRTPNWKRKPGKFKHAGSERYPRDITLAQALERLDKEIELLGGVYPLLSTNVATRLDGRPRAGQSAPQDPGACVYFSLRGQPYALACDTYTEVEQNVAALAAHINATRAITRHGVASAEDTLQAFSALPPPGGGGLAWRKVLGFAPDWPKRFSGSVEDQAAEINIQFRQRAAKAHPDVPGGSHEAFAALAAARDAALQEISS